MGDFTIRIGILAIGSTRKVILMQVEYNVLATQKAAVFIEDFMKQLLTEDGYAEMVICRAGLKNMGTEDNQERTMHLHQRLRQFTIPLIDDNSS